MSEKIKAIHGDVEAADFVQRHSRVIEPLAVVSSGTRRVTGSGADGLLSEDEKTELKGACAAFGVAWTASYNRPLTPKGHIIVVRGPVRHLRRLRGGRLRGASHIGLALP